MVSIDDHLVSRHPRRESSLVQYVSGVYAGTMGVASLNLAHRIGDYAPLINANRQAIEISSGLGLLAVTGLTLYKGQSWLRENKGIIPSQDGTLDTIAGKFFLPAVLTFALEELALAYFLYQ